MTFPIGQYGVTSQYPNGVVPGQLPVGNNGVLDNPKLDEVWAGNYKGAAPNPYYDYFFAGQDIRVYIDGLWGDPNFSDMAIASLGFRVEQQTRPLYGYNDYVYRTVVKGQRIVSGNLAIYSRSPDYMMQAVAAAAQVRQDMTRSLNDNYIVPLTEDDANIQAYWGNNDDPINAGGTKPNLFSTHPPFSLVIIYGVQDVSLGSNASQDAQALKNYYSALAGDQLLNLDTNDRLVPTAVDSNQMRLVIDDIQLISMNTMYDPSGQPIVESYDFVARDIIYP